jgi:arsenate reductase
MRHVLFVCSEHDGRSQMAQVFFERHAPRGVGAESAGVRSPKRVRPAVVEAMRELGVDIAGGRPRRLLVEMQIHADLAVTLGCRNACPYVARRVEEWEVDDLAGLDLDDVRAIRDRIEQLVRGLVADRLPELLGERSAHAARLIRLLPVLVDEFQGVRSPEEIRSCTDAILSQYDTAAARPDVLTVAHTRTQDCLRADVCRPLAPVDDRVPQLLGRREYDTAPGRPALLTLAQERADHGLRAEVCAPLASA